MRDTVIIDHQVFSSHTHGGISMLFSTLLKEFDQTDYGLDLDVACRFSANHHLRCVRPGRYIGLPDLRGRGRINAALNRIVAPSPRRGASLIHTTFYDVRDLPPPGIPLVTTVYDMIPELMPQLFPYGSPHVGKDVYCARADHVICISERTRDDAVRLLGLDKERTSVVYPGINVDEARHDRLAVPDLPPAYFLFVGNRSGYKNFTVLLHGLARLGAQVGMPPLICVGPTFTAEEQTQIAQLGLAGQVRHLKASDAQLRTLYHQATAFVFTSLYEGFGIPIIEAFAQGCPLVLANASCFPEIAGEAALYFFPDDPESCAAALRSILDDPQAASRRAELGRRRLEGFTSAAMARSMATVYRQVLEARRHPAWQSRG